jgi:hypothetical protein
MNKRSKLAALLGAGLLTFAVAGVALANTLSEDHPNQAGKTVTELIDGGVSEDCSDFTGANAVGEGEVGFHFTLTPQLSADTGNISGSVDGTNFGPIANTPKNDNGNGAMHFYVVVTGDADSVLNDATTDVTGGTLQVSHICIGETPGGGGGGDTDQPPTDALPGTTGSSGPTDGAWLLVVALGVLLASIVVLTPARAKSRR